MIFFFTFVPKNLSCTVNCKAPTYGNKTKELAMLV